MVWIFHKNERYLMERMTGWSFVTSTQARAARSSIQYNAGKVQGASLLYQDQAWSWLCVESIMLRANIHVHVHTARTWHHSCTNDGNMHVQSQRLHSAGRSFLFSVWPLIGP